ncbi:MAG: hypothetical protein PHO94_00435 [Petrimonas sp.]|nr:hypothetical protein [Petrimonas sp.]
MDYEFLFIKSLILTISIEMVVLILFFRLIIKSEDISISRLISTAFIASFATLPYLWFVLPTYIDQKIWYVIIGESFAVLAETFIINAILKINVLKSFLISLTCNLISFLIGLIINIQ